MQNWIGQAMRRWVRLQAGMRPSAMRRRYGIGLLMIVLLAGMPVLSVLLAGTISSSHGCTLNEANSHPCIVMGRDVGEILYVLGVMGWLMLVSLPFGAVALFGWLLLLLGHLALRAHARRQGWPPP